MKNIKGPSVFTGESFSRLINATAEMDRIVNEIAIVAKVSPDEVYEFYQSHQYSLEFIKQGVLLCGTLDKDAMENAIVEMIKKLNNELNEWVETIAEALSPIFEALVPALQKTYDIFWKAYLEAGAPYGKNSDSMMRWYHEMSKARRLRLEVNRLLICHRMLADFQKVINERQTTR
jgi:hypothetical protein